MGWRVIKTIAICLLVAFAALAALAVVRVGIPVVSMYRNAMEVVDQSTEDTFKAEQTSLVYDVDGNEIKKLKGEKDVHYLEYEDIPDAAKLAIIAIEDKNFTSHRGIDIEGIARAAIALIQNHGEITQGGSTITQQLARNVFTREHRLGVFLEGLAVARLVRAVEDALHLNREETWYIGDSIENDIEGAGGAGWHAILLNRRHNDTSAIRHKPDYIVESEEELLKLLERLL